MKNFLKYVTFITLSLYVGIAMAIHSEGHRGLQSVYFVAEGGPKLLNPGTPLTNFGTAIAGGNEFSFDVIFNSTEPDYAFGAQDGDDIYIDSGVHRAGFEIRWDSSVVEFTTDTSNRNFRSSLASASNRPTPTHWDPRAEGVPGTGVADNDPDMDMLIYPFWGGPICNFLTRMIFLLNCQLNFLRPHFVGKLMPIKVRRQ